MAWLIDSSRYVKPEKQPLSCFRMPEHLPVAGRLVSLLHPRLMGDHASKPTTLARQHIAHMIAIVEAERISGGAMQVIVLS